MMDILGNDFKNFRNLIYDDHTNGFYINAPNKKHAFVQEFVDYVVRYPSRLIMASSRIGFIDPIDKEIIYWDEDDPKSLIQCRKCHYKGYIANLLLCESLMFLLS